MPHQLCHFHYLREAAKPVYEADRHAKVQLKKKVRGIRPIERKVEGRDDAEARGDPGLLRGGALGVDRRRPAAAGGLGAEAARTGWPRSPRAWTGSAQKGAPEGADPAAGDPGQGPGGDRGAVAGRAGGLRLGASRGGDPPQQEGAGRRRGAASLPRADRRRSPGIAEAAGRLVS